MIHVSEDGAAVALRWASGDRVAQIELHPRLAAATKAVLNWRAC